VGERRSLQRADRMARARKTVDTAVDANVNARIAIDGIQTRTMAILRGMAWCATNDDIELMLVCLAKKTDALARTIDGKPAKDAVRAERARRR